MLSEQTSDARDMSQRLRFTAAPEDNTETADDSPGGDASLEDVAEREHEYLRGRLRNELGREPTEEELNEWLREHTEGY